MNKNQINISDTWDRLEEISCTLERIDELHNAVLHKYLRDTIDYNVTHIGGNNTSDERLRIRDLCITYPTYTALLEIAHSFVQEVRGEINDIIETATQ